RAGEAFAERARRLEPLVLHFLELGAPVLEFLDRRRRRATRLARGDQVVAREAVAHLDDVAELSEVDDFLEQDDLPVGSRAQWLSVYGSSARKRARLIASCSWRW